jgi:hypothetical protein|tara:strand:+ start:146 stop:1075 length:930 start_codon:yes stop_codon:yes gene_type:complete
MKLTRRRIQQLIQESLIDLLESRILKQKFYQQVRSKYPDIDQAYWVVWWRDGIAPKTVWESTADQLTETLPKIGPSTTFDIPCNLVDPGGVNILPHAGFWGSVGLVFQGIPTAGFKFDVGSNIKGKQKSDRQRWNIDKLSPIVNKPNTWAPGAEAVRNPDGSIKWSEEGDLIRTGGDAFRKGRSPEDYDADIDLFQGYENYSSIPTFDVNVASPFLTHQPGFKYNVTEFAVVPKRAVGLVLHNDLDYIEQKTGKRPTQWHTQGSDEGNLNTPPAETAKEMKKVAQQFNLPIFIGPKQISEYYKSLYSKK